MAGLRDGAARRLRSRTPDRCVARRRGRNDESGPDREPLSHARGCRDAQTRRRRRPISTIADSPLPTSASDAGSGAVEATGGMEPFR